MTQTTETTANSQEPTTQPAETTQQASQQPKANSQEPTEPAPKSVFISDGKLPQPEPTANSQEPTASYELPAQITALQARLDAIESQRTTETRTAEVETAMDIALRDGTPANRLATDLKQYLKHPDNLFRRVRDEHGQLQLSKRAKEFHPGQGVYRSSYKNARRLAVTETNMAYHKADNERWRQLDFVLGYEVQVSGTNPNVCPLCMELAGKYPKEFARGYIELQYHGVLTPECVESVFIPQDVLRKLNANILQLIKKSGAIVYSEDAYGNLITL